ncbi:MAG: hypothetical protein PF904_10950 [Kiritimatiellae bacterium]|jgi:hypothetical protein|nr:hypothetical protein [Kiritimatiellia bacterium]
MYTLHIQTAGNAEAQLNALAETATRRQYLSAVSRTASNTFVRNFESQAQKKHRGGSFNYYLTAARNTTGSVDDDSAVIRIAAPAGIGLRRYGGTVVPSGRPSRITGKPITKLTIPVKGGPADGKSTLDMQTAGVKLHLVVLKRLGLAALAGPADAGGESKFYFWLVPSTTHQPDPTVFPSNDVLSRDINKTLTRVFTTAFRKGTYHVSK